MKPTPKLVPARTKSGEFDTPFPGLEPLMTAGEEGVDTSSHGSKVRCSALDGDRGEMEKSHADRPGCSHAWQLGDGVKAWLAE